MMQARRIAANEISEKLFAAEAAIDAAIAAVAALTAQLPVATQQANAGPHIMQAALMHSMESCQQLVKSRTNIIRTHSALRAVQDDMGLGNVDFAPTGFNELWCPKSADSLPETRMARPHLAAVAA